VYINLNNGYIKKNKQKYKAKKSMFSSMDR
jgi:hypothetical protein